MGATIQDRGKRERSNDTKTLWAYLWTLMGISGSMSVFTNC